MYPFPPSNMEEEYYIYLTILISSASSAMFLPVMQSLLYHQACVASYHCEGQNDHIPSHREANYAMLLGTIFMCCTSLWSSPSIGRYSDRVSRRKAMVIPFIGNILSDVTIIVFSSTTDNLANYGFVIGEIILGLFGGYMTVLSSAFAYLGSMHKFEHPDKRSVSMSTLQGMMGLGGFLGNMVHVVIEGATHTFHFYVIALLHCLCIILVLYGLHDRPSRNISVDLQLSETRLGPSSQLQDNPAGNIKSVVDNGSKELSSKKQETVAASIENGSEIQSVLASKPLPKETFWKATPIRMLYYLAFAVSFFSMIGSAQILYFHLQFKFRDFVWRAGYYSYFVGWCRLASTGTALFLYPYLKNVKNLSDTQLALIGLVARIVAKTWIGLTSVPVILYFAVVFEAFGRFPATALRSLISSNTKREEQGLAFGHVAVLEAWCHMGAAIIFHILYPWSMPFFPEMSFLLMSAVIIIPTILIWYHDPARRANDEIPVEISVQKEETV